MSTDANTTNIKEEYNRYVKQYNEFTNNIVYKDLDKIHYHSRYESNSTGITFGNGKNKKNCHFKLADSNNFTLGVHAPSTW